VPKTGPKGFVAFEKQTPIKTAFSKFSVSAAEVPWRTVEQNWQENGILPKQLIPVDE